MADLANSVCPLSFLFIYIINVAPRELWRSLGENVCHGQLRFITVQEIAAGQSPTALLLRTLIFHRSLAKDWQRNNAVAAAARKRHSDRLPVEMLWQHSPKISASSCCVGSAAVGPLPSRSCRWRKRKIPGLQRLQQERFYEFNFGTIWTFLSVYGKLKVQKGFISVGFYATWRNL